MGQKQRIRNYNGKSGLERALRRIPSDELIVTSNCINLYGEQHIGIGERIVTVRGGFVLEPAFRVEVFEQNRAYTIGQRLDETPKGRTMKNIFKNLSPHYSSQKNVK
jgi:hypothetical protein